MKDLQAKWNPAFIDAVPGSVMSMVFEQIDFQTITACMRVCKSWRASALSTLQMKPTIAVLPTTVVTNRIHKLPNEILIDTFHYLDTRDLVACQETCVKWKTIVSNNPSLWSESVRLFGVLKEIDDRWSFVREILAGRQKVKALKIKYSYHDGNGHLEGYSRRWSWTLLSQEFPHQTLHTFEYSCSQDLDSENVWNCVLQCEQLKVLRIECDEISKFYVNGTNLARCRLEELQLIDEYCHKTFEVDDGVFDMLREAMADHYSRPLLQRKESRSQYYRLQ